MKKEERPKQNYINFGSSVRPVGSLRQIQPFLDAKVYNIDVLPMSGPVLEIVDNIDLSVPERVYGDIMARVNKSFEAYGYRDRNTGILLSGERGMGKTLFIRIAINRALGMGMPVIMLKKTDELSGIIETINSITQPVLIVMDEFEKNFMATFGVKVQVYTQDDTALADNNLKIISGKSLKIDGRMKVKTVRENFKETYGFCLRVYNTQNHFVDDDDLICAVRQDDNADRSGDITINPEWTIDEFEKKIMETYGVKVQVYTPDDTKLADNDIKLFWGNKQ